VSHNATRVRILSWLNLVLFICCFPRNMDPPYVIQTQPARSSCYISQKHTNLARRSASSSFAFSLAFSSTTSKVDGCIASTPSFCRRTERPKYVGYAVLWPLEGSDAVYIPRLYINRRRQGRTAPRPQSLRRWGGWRTSCHPDC